MGLDNSINIRRTAHILWLQRFKDPWSDDYEICYWRRHYNIRNGILQILGVPRSGDGEFAISYDQLLAIIELLKSFNENNWADDGGCWICTFQEARKRLKKDIRNLKRLARLMRKHEIEVYFVDSY